MIGILAGSTTSSTPSYPVTVALGESPVTLSDGSGASPVITVGTVANALVVPTSAVSSVGAEHSVSVLTDDKPASAPVEVGVVGPAVTQFISGLAHGPGPTGGAG